MSDIYKNYQEITKVELIEFRVSLALEAGTCSSLPNIYKGSPGNSEDWKLGLVPHTCNFYTLEAKGR